MSATGDVRVAPDRLAASARATRALADTVRSLDLGGPVRDAGAALPGSATAGAAQALAERWIGSVAAVTEALLTQASGLEASVDAYRRSDGAIAADLRDSPQSGPGAITRALG